MGDCEPRWRKGRVVVSRAPTLAARRPAYKGRRTCPRASPPASSLGNARDCAPSLSTIDIIFNSTIFLWTWMLTSLTGWAVLPGGMRSTRLGLHVLTGSFNVIVLLADTIALAAVAAANPLLP